MRRGSPGSPAAGPQGRRPHPHPRRGAGGGITLSAAPGPPRPARNGCGAGPGPARGSRRGGAAAPAPPPRRPPPSPPRAARAQSGGSSGRGNSSGSGSSSRSAPFGSARPGPAPRPRRRACRGASGSPAARLTLKFLAVLLAAGMLAFLGAVICIIASVPLAASPARALPGGADNASAASAAAAAAAASPGPQRSLSALHGAGGSAGPPALPGAPAASAHPLPPAPLFSRFLCTPLAAACPSGAEQGDAAAGEREELLLLQSTAEQLRQTALQQEARIRADQDTIRELTGKLGRCESGLPRGLQDAGPRRDAMADGPWDSPALILELEDAVRALRDRLDRIEVSAASRRAPTGAWEGRRAGGRRWKGEAGARRHRDPGAGGARERPVPLPFSSRHLCGKPQFPHLRNGRHRVRG